MSKVTDKQDSLVFGCIEDGVDTATAITKELGLAKQSVVSSLRRLMGARIVFSRLTTRRELGISNSCERINQYKPFDKTKSMVAQMAVVSPIDIYLYPKLAEKIGATYG